MGAACLRLCADVVASGAAAQRERSHKRAIAGKDILCRHVADGRYSTTTHIALLHTVMQPASHHPAFSINTPSGSQRLLSRETLDAMRCRVTAAGAVDAVLRVPLEFGLGCGGSCHRNSASFIHCSRVFSFMVGGDVPWNKHASGGSFGHTGAGGCVSFADVQNEVRVWPPRALRASDVMASCFRCSTHCL